MGDIIARSVVQDNIKKNYKYKPVRKKSERVSFQ